MKAIVCLVTVPNKTVARKMARQLVELKTAACVNIVGPIESHFYWQKTLEKASEQLLIIKTIRSKYPALRELVEKLHPYSVPEIIALPVVLGNAPYLNWVQQTVSSK